MYEGTGPFFQAADEAESPYQGEELKTVKSKRVAKDMFMGWGKGQSNVHSTTGHEDPEKE